MGPMDDYQHVTCRSTMKPPRGEDDEGVKNNHTSQRRSVDLSPAGIYNHNPAYARQPDWAALGFRHWTRQELESAITSHGGAKGLSLADINLAGEDLSGMNLNGIALSRPFGPGMPYLGANLSETNLSRAYLEEADLRGANLAGANLTGAQLRNARLAGANFHGAKLHGAVLIDADMRSASLNHAQFNAVGEIPAATLNLALLRNAALNASDLRGASLLSAD